MRTAIKLINLACLLLSVVWLARAPDWEPLIVFLGFLVAFLVQEIKQSTTAESIDVIDNKDLPHDTADIARDASAATLVEAPQHDLNRMPDDSCESPMNESKPERLSFADLPASPRDFYERDSRLKGRFAELERFRERLKGHTMKWTAYVNSVSKSYYSDSILIDLEDAETGFSRSLFLRLPGSQRERAMALRPGDLIGFDGTFEDPDSIGGPLVVAEDFTLIETTKVE